jgi:glycosyltransferase involved in cell wall biosynthesis
VPVPFGASDWVDPAVFRPLPGTAKRYDAVMVARWSLTKRHKVLFQALRELSSMSDRRDPSFRVALLVPSWVEDTDRAAIEALMAHYRVAEQIDVSVDLAPDEVNAVYNQSKVNVVLSLQEGSNRALFEGFFAGVPGLALADNVGIPKAYFTPQTGRLIRDAELAAALRHFRDHGADYAPRAWAEAHIAPPITTARLNAVLRDLAGARGEPWTRDIVAKCNRPELHYYPDAAAGADLPTVHDLAARYPRSHMG